MVQQSPEQVLTLRRNDQSINKSISKSITVSCSSGLRVLYLCPVHVKKLNILDLGHI